MTSFVHKSLVILTIGLAACSPSPNQDSEYTRGIGVYPSRAEDYTGPEMVSGGSEYRNLALNRAVWHSSSFDYNLTGHLLTDGIIENGPLYVFKVSTQDGDIAKRDREKIMDENFTAIEFAGSEDAFLLIEMPASNIDADKISFEGTAYCIGKSDYDIEIQAAGEDGQWQTLEAIKGSGMPGAPETYHMRAGTAGSQNVSLAAGLLETKAVTSTKPGPPSVFEKVPQTNNREPERGVTRECLFTAAIPSDSKFSTYRLKLASASVETWSFTEVTFTKDNERVEVLPSWDFQSAWMSEGCKDEWVYVDLGARSSIDKIKLHWISEQVGGKVQVSDDAKSWKQVANFTASDEFKAKGKGRYVRIAFDNAESGAKIALSEIKIYGKGGVIAKPKAAAVASGDKLPLAGGNWKIQRAAQVSGSRAEISTTAFDASNWVIATVPGTVLTSYYNIGAIPDIRYDDDQLQISESFFNSDFWYRDEFVIPSEFDTKALTLNFDGINWKAEVWFNGVRLGDIDGAFIRGNFNITGIANVGGTNVLAVKIHSNDHPGIIKEQNRITADTNGGILGADNPTFHATIGWDWIPTVRGRNIGIWNDVYVTADAGVSIKDVFIPTDLPLPSTDFAELKPVVTLVNHADSPVEGIIDLKFGELAIGCDYALAAGETRDIELPLTRLEHPQLWWPHGYGEPYLYDVNVEVRNNGQLSDAKSLKSGVREMSYTMDSDGVLDFYINGRRLIGNGGNWGYPEINNNYRGREYDIAVAYHADMNFTMIRNWVGMTGDDEFFEACDKYGVMIWQDFWLANPYDGPNPDDNALFLTNAEDFLRRIRRHPSIAIYVGRNEGFPPEELNNGLARLISDLHPGIYYLPHSATGPVSGNGPYRALPVEEYFNAVRGYDRFHSERGMPNVMTAESIRQMLREENHWPQTSVWGVHDYTMENAQSCATFNELIATGFGEPSSLDEFAEHAQWINYNGYRAMYESRSWNRKGLLIWMSHSCWPSMVWQTYDYYLEPTAAYFGAKKGSAPIRIQWNPISKQVEVVNNNASDQPGLTAHAAVINYDGKTVYEKEYALDSPEDTTIPVFPLEFDSPELSEVYYIKLSLKRGEELIADNFYWESKVADNYQLLNSLGTAELIVTSKTELKDGQYQMVAEVINKSDVPALMIHLRIVGDKTCERMLPVFYEDNWFSLMPGESKTVKIHFAVEDTRGESPVLKVDGFNSSF